MDLVIIARFHVVPGQGAIVATALKDVVGATLQEAGCVDVRAFRSREDTGLFYICSRWIDEASFQLHTELPHTVQFMAVAGPSIIHPLEVHRMVALD